MLTAHGLIRTLLLAALGVPFTGLAPAKAQGFPAKPVRIIVPYPPGGTSDFFARALSPKLSEFWKQPVLVENKPGANGNLGADFVAKSSPDGYTLLLGDISALAISPSVYPQLPFDPTRDFAAVAVVAYSPHVLVVHPSVPAKNVRELVAYAKSNPGKLNYAISGVSLQLAGVEFATRTGIQWTYIPYKGGAQAISDTAGGHANVMFNGMPATLPHVKSGALKLLAVSSASRTSAIPDVPTVAESGVSGFQTGTWQGIVAPAATPREIVNKVHADVRAVVAMPDMRERLVAQGGEASPMTPDALAAFIRDEKARWGRVVKEGNVKVE